MGFSSDPAGVVNQSIGSLNLPSVDQKELFEDRLEEILRDLSTILNTKEGALYTLDEKICYKQIFTTGNPQAFRNVYRRTYDLIDLNGGNIGAGVTVSFAHGLTNLTDSIMIYVSCVSAVPQYWTAVYPDVFLDATNITFINPDGVNALTSAIAVCEYTKN